MQTLTQELRETKKKMKQFSQERIDAILNELPKDQRELVATCFKAAKCSKNGMRYTRAYVYDCLLMKMMSPKLYRKLRKEKKMPLPCEMTLSRCLEKIKPAYGFQRTTFCMMEKKKDHFTEAQRHG